MQDGRLFEIGVGPRASTARAEIRIVEILLESQGHHRQGPRRFRERRGKGFERLPRQFSIVGVPAQRGQTNQVTNTDGVCRGEHRVERVTRSGNQGLVIFRGEIKALRLLVPEQADLLIGQAARGLLPARFVCRREEGQEPFGEIRVVFEVAGDLRLPRAIGSQQFALGTAHPVEHEVGGLLGGVKVGIVAKVLAAPASDPIINPLQAASTLSSRATGRRVCRLSNNLARASLRRASTSSGVTCNS